MALTDLLVGFLGTGEQSIEGIGKRGRRREEKTGGIEGKGRGSASSPHEVPYNFSAVVAPCNSP